MLLVLKEISKFSVSMLANGFDYKNSIDVCTLTVISLVAEILFYKK